MSQAFEKLQEKYLVINDIANAANVLQWDQQVYMPPKGAEARGRQLATLEGLVHERMTDPQIGELLKTCEGENLNADQEAYRQELLWQYKRAVTLPPNLVTEFALAESKAYNAWQTARRDRDFKQFAPHLKKLLELSHQKAECYGYEESPWDALAQGFERGMTAKKVSAVFDELRDFSKDLLARINAAPKVNDAFLSREATSAQQQEFALRVVRDMGYDFGAGRLDTTVHPFCTNFSIHDVRITTRYTQNSPLDSVAAVIHEAGHALYEQGFRADDEGTPLANAPSLGLHESQSRFWEVRVAKSRAFCEGYLPHIKQYFPGTYDDLDAETFYRGYNAVTPDLIRVEANEVTYNLHVIIRFQLEVALVDGSLSVDDLPAEWNRLYKEYLGVDVPHDGVGCLQDVHWSSGLFGYFPSYSFGNIYGAMLVEKMEEDIEEMWDLIREGRFAPLLDWLRINVHRVGRRLDAQDIVSAVTGKPVSSEALMRYLDNKYSEIYGL